MDEMDKNYAVIIQGAYKHYGFSNKVLKGLNMTVTKGTIYGLLGASGCGKTTLLSCIVGASYLNAGSIKLCIKDRSQLGYMPQDLALFENFSIEETFYYYGRIYNLSDSCIHQRIEFLVTLLQIPNTSKIISSLSGGQQRRVSFSTALLPTPDIIILDEPTVGQDPILSFSIWEYLRNLTAENKTVIVTTHYIEEAKLANTVGFMRNGVLLDEGPPTELMSNYNCSTLEDVFLHLCYNQDTHIKTTAEEFQNAVMSRPFKNGFQFSYRRLLAQWIKNYLWIKKNVLSVLVLIIILPMIEVLILTICVGNPPTELPIVVVNMENNGSCISPSYGDCSNTLGCRFIDQLHLKGLHITHYSNEKSSVPDLEGSAAVWASIIIPENFTALTEERLRLGFDTDDTLLNASFINTTIDMSNMIIGNHIKQALVDGCLSAMKSWNYDCGWPVKSAMPPILFMDPIHGRSDTTFVDFMSPGILCLFAFCLSLLFSMCALLYEKVNGSMERSLIAGVLWLEILLAHITVASIFICGQVTVMMFIMFHIRNVQYYGSLGLIFCLVVLQGFSGMGCGILVAVLFNNEAAALNITLGIIIGLFFLTGALWPVEGMHWIASYLSLLVPVTVPIQSLRYIVAQGRSLESLPVYQGFLISIGWLCFFVLTSVFIIRRKDK